MIILEKVNKIYKSKEFSKNIFEDLNFEINQGDFIKILGPNGSGKSTFLKLIKKLILPDKGRISYNEKIKNSDIALVTQNQRSFFLNLTVKQNLLFFCSLNSKKSLNLETKIKDKLRIFDLSEKFDTDMYALSSGELKKVSIIRALLKAPKLLLLDEVTSNLEEKNRLFFTNYIREELNQNQNVSIIWTTHYPNEIHSDYEKSFLIEDSSFVEL